MKSVYIIAPLAIVSGVRDAAAAGEYCVDLWNACDGDQDDCCSGYCSKANLDDEGTQCIPHVPEGDICSTNGEIQQWICESYLQCINNEDGTEATCQDTPEGKIFCGYDSRIYPGETNFVATNQYCDDTQYCHSSLMECYDYLDEGDSCFSRGPFFKCKEGLICKDDENGLGTGTCVSEEQCIPDWQTGCWSSDISPCCNDSFYCGVAEVNGTESSCIAYVPEGGICRVPTGEFDYGETFYQTWECEDDLVCQRTQGAWRCLERPYEELLEI
eukprot:Clim_evm5s158 gene=Clim_evmTU5s158